MLYRPFLANALVVCALPASRVGCGSGSLPPPQCCFCVAMPQSSATREVLKESSYWTCFFFFLVARWQTGFLSLSSPVAHHKGKPLFSVGYSLLRDGSSNGQNKGALSTSSMLCLYLFFFFFRSLFFPLRLPLAVLPCFFHFCFSASQLIHESRQKSTCSAELQ